MNSSSFPIRTVLQDARNLLAPISSYPGHNAELLLRHVLARDRAWLLANPDVPLTESQMERYQAFLARRLQHEPIQYIVGEQEFYGLRFRVTPAVLIPRPETEHLVEAVLARLSRDRPLHIADVGTGSGAIALALAHERPLARVDALDISPDALAIAEENARALGLISRVRCLESDLLAAVSSERYDAIVSNPPYVASTERLEPQVAEWEPHGALFAGPDGLAVYRAFLPQAIAHLRPGGLFAAELGAGQQAALETLFAQDPRWSAPLFVPDLQGIPRVALVHRRAAAGVCSWGVQPGPVFSF